MIIFPTVELKILEYTHLRPTSQIFKMLSWQQSYHKLVYIFIEMFFLSFFLYLVSTL